MASRILTPTILLALVVLLGAGYLDMRRRVNALESALENLAGAEVASGSRAEVGGPRRVAIDGAPTLGDAARARVAVVEFSDFNCPYCARFRAETLGAILDEHVTAGEVLYVYKSFVGVGGQRTFDAAAAAECVREQVGDATYLAMVDDLYAAPDVKTRELVVRYAEGLPLDHDRFEACVATGRMARRVDADTRAGRAAGVGGTPGFVIGPIAEGVDGEGLAVEGINLFGAQPYEVFDRAIREQLAGAAGD